MPDFAAFAVELAIFGLLGAFGGAASYVHRAMKHKSPFQAISFVAGLFLAFFVGAACGMYVAPEDPKRIFYSMALGFLASPILNLADTQGARIAQWVKTAFKP